MIAGDETDMSMDVLLFMERMGQGTPFSPGFPNDDTVKMRLDLIEEEYTELLEAVSIYDLVGTADAIIDLIYVTIGMGHALGLPVDDLWREVQRSNMEKADGPVRDDGKRLKPEGWTPPDIAGVLDRALR